MIKSSQSQVGLQRNSFMRECMEDFVESYREDEIRMYVSNNNIKGKPFNLYYPTKYLKAGDIIRSGWDSKFKVLSTPKSRWFLKLLQWITFGLYKAPTYYKVIQVDEVTTSFCQCDPLFYPIAYGSSSVVYSECDKPRK